MNKIRKTLHDAINLYEILTANGGKTQNDTGKCRRFCHKFF